MERACRVCFEPANKRSGNRLVRPCACADGAHPRCLDAWRAARRAGGFDCDSCGVCLRPYAAYAPERPALLAARDFVTRGVWPSGWLPRVRAAAAIALGLAVLAYLGGIFCDTRIARRFGDDELAFRFRLAGDVLAAACGAAHLASSWPRTGVLFAIYAAAIAFGAPVCEWSLATHYGPAAPAQLTRAILGVARDLGWIA